MKKHLLGFSTVLAIIMVFMVSTYVFGASNELPKLIGFGTYASGSKAYAVGMGVARAIEKNAGIQARVVPLAPKARVMSVMKKETLFGCQYEPTNYEMQGGVWNFQEEGPQDVALMWVGYKGGTALMWKGDEGIKTPADIKGKRVPHYGDYSPGQQMLFMGKLAFYGIGEDEVVWVRGATYSKGMQMLIDGKVDVSYCAPSASKVSELASSVHGVVIPECPAADKDGWARAKAICPVFGPGKVEVGYGATAENPKEWFCYPGYYHTRFDSDEHLIYTIVKAMYDGYDIYKNSHPEAALWNIDNALDMEQMNNTGMPYHSGSIKLFKEIGRWTDRHEKWQQSRLEFRNRIQKAYKAVLEEARAKGIEVKSPEFAQMWFPVWKQMRMELAAQSF